MATTQKTYKINHWDKDGTFTVSRVRRDGIGGGIIEGHFVAEDGNEYDLHLSRNQLSRQVGHFVSEAYLPVTR